MGAAAKRWVKGVLGDAFLLAHPPSALVPLSRLTRLHIVLGTPCNCRCSMCCQPDFNTVMVPALYEKALRPLYPHLREVILQGGEPTRLPQVRPFAELVLRENSEVRFAIFTNGQRFDEEWASFFVDHGSYVHFSINATTEATYRRITSGDVDWNRLLNNIRSLAAARAVRSRALRIQTSMVVIDDNLPELSGFLDFSRELGGDVIQYYFDPARLPRDRELARRELDRAAEWRRANPRTTVEGLEMLSHRLLGTPPAPPVCSWPFDSLHVDVNGDARFCCLINKKLGNLGRTGVAPLWNGWRARRLRKMVGDGNLRFCGHYCRPAKGGA